MKKILIVEDTKSILTLLMMQFQKSGFDVQGAPDAMLGTRACTQWRPDLVILDLMLPAGGGIAVLRFIRQSVHTSAIPVIVLTATESPAMRKTVTDFGVYSFLTKPHDPDVLMKQVKNALLIEEGKS